MKKRILCLCLIALLLGLTACDGATTHTHEFGPWQVEVQSDCRSAGMQKRTCACGETEWENLPLGDHHFVDGVCRRCGASFMGELEYALNEEGNGYKVVGMGTVTDTELVIPAKYNDLPVTEIGEGAFSMCDQLTSVTFNGLLPQIGDNAFYGCSGLTSVMINAIIVGESAFAQCVNLEEVYTFDTMEIGRSAFSGCQNLRYVELCETVLQVGSGAFDGCTALESIVIADDVRGLNCTFTDTVYYQNPQNWTDGALYIGHNLIALQAQTVGEDYTIQNGTESIGCEVFRDLENLRTVTVPISVAYISEGAFHGCAALEQILYGGYKSTWEQVEKAEGWIVDCGGYVSCADGEVYY